MHSVIRIGSRESALAVRQAEIIRDLILESEPEAEIEIITMKTTGDKILDKSLEKIGGKGLFVERPVRQRAGPRPHGGADRPRGTQLKRYAYGGK